MPECLDVGRMGRLRVAQQNANPRDLRRLLRLTGRWDDEDCDGQKQMRTAMKVVACMDVARVQARGRPAKPLNGWSLPLCGE